MRFFFELCKEVTILNLQCTHFVQTQMDLSGRLYGEYRCGSCRRKWTSLDATEKYQECRTCEEDAKRIVARPLEYSVSGYNKKNCDIVL